MVVTRGGFSQVVANGFAGLGFAEEAPTVQEFPVQMFEEGSDLSPIKENLDKIVYGLTKWEPKNKAKGVTNPPKITVQGKDYQAAAANMNNLFLKNMWGDGLPITPATKELVDWILTGTDLPRDKVIGKIMPRGGIATVETLAVNLAMAGGRPEYLPLLIASIEAIMDPLFELERWNATTRAVVPAMIVNGPIAKQIRLAYGYGVLGPDPLHPTGGSVGRAVRFILMNVGGATPGIGSMAIFGGPARYTGLVFAEDEDGIPQGWNPLNVERGFPKGSNTVTTAMVGGMVNMTVMNAPERTFLDMYAGNLRIPNFQYWGPESKISWDKGVAGILLLPRTRAQGAADILGSKEKLKAYLWENSKVPWSVVEKTLGLNRIRIVTERVKDSTFPMPKGEPWPIAAKPENIMVVVAGGDQGGQVYYMMGAFIEPPITREIKLPAKWNDLLKQAEKDLGPAPTGL